MPAYILAPKGRLLLSVTHILDLSKIEAGKMELFITSFEIENMVETIKNISEPLAAKNDNGFVVNFDGAMGSMSQDETKLRQCLTNFLSNGFKLRTSEAEGNGSGHTYIYMAFAENPFVTSTGVPTTAR